MTVGNSYRTAYKHRLLNKLVGREVGIVSLPRFKALSYTVYDLCAGNGDPAEHSSTSSPEIIINHLSWLNDRGMARPRAIFVERDKACCEQLQAKYRKNSFVEIKNCDARKIEPIESRHRFYNFVYADPNHVHDWPFSDEFISQLPQNTTLLLTMGCNVGGIKRLPVESRMVWLERTWALCQSMNQHHDALLVSLSGDSARWAYLIVGPSRWMVCGTYEADVMAAFAESPGIKIAYWHDDRAAFVALCEQLMLRSTERIEHDDIKIRKLAQAKQQTFF
jgi:hypothetical protein